MSCGGVRLRAVAHGNREESVRDRRLRI